MTRGRRGHGIWRGAALCAVLAACAPAVELYEVAGTVLSVDVHARQFTVAHEDIPGLMPAMTMNFDIADAALLARVGPGDRIRFTLERTHSSLRVIAIETTSEADVAGGAPVAGVSGSAPPPVPERAAPISLIDQDGRRFELADLSGSAVLLDFIFTRCGGPCPILTARQVALQRSLDSELRECARFVSVSLDPEHDLPHVLRDYARERGADLQDWSFLTGEPEAVEAVLEAYGVGAVRVDGGTLEHLVATFLIDRRGQIAERYLGLEDRPEEISEDLRLACS